jgi:hypothetical protein
VRQYNQGCEDYRGCAWIVAVTVENETDVDTSQAPQFSFGMGTNGHVFDLGDCDGPLEAAGTGDSQCQATVEMDIGPASDPVVTVDAGSHTGSDTADAT